MLVQLRGPTSKQTTETLLSLFLMLSPLLKMQMPALGAVTQQVTMTWLPFILLLLFVEVSGAEPASGWTILPFLEPWRASDPQLAGC